MKTTFIFLFLLSIVIAYDWTQAETIINNAINEGMFSGAVLAVANINSTYIKKAYGTTIPKRGFYAPPMQVNYKFDLNRLSQVIGTNSALMELYDQGSINITRRVSAMLTDFNNNNKTSITVDQMLEHNSGFPADYTAAFPATPALLLKNIQGLKLQSVVQTKFQYSQIGYTVLGHAVQKVKNQTLNNATFQILTLAGCRDTGYIPTSPKDQIVPGGYNNGVCRGIPANKYANFLGNIAGNAGLFSTVDNLITYMQLLLNKGKIPNQSRIFSQEVVNLYTTATIQKKYNNTYAKGWETVPAQNAPCGRKFSKNSFGLADTSGSYIWSDKSNNVTIAFLANGNFPVQKSTPTDFQGKLSDAIMTALGY